MFITQGARRTEFTYGASGELATVRDPIGNVTRFEHDEVSRILTEVLPDQRRIIYQHDRNGLLISISPPGRPAHEFGYNLFELLARYLAPLLGKDVPPTETRYTYNNDKQLTKIELPGKSEIGFSYGRTDGLLKTMKTERGEYGYSYTQDGRLNGIKSPDGVTLDIELNGPLVKILQTTFADNVKAILAFGYSADMALSDIKMDGKVVSYTYDPDGLLTGAGDEKVVHSADLGLMIGTELGVVSESYGYDPGYGELVSMKAYLRSNPNSKAGSVSQQATSIFSEAMSRDDLGRIVVREEQYAGHVSKFIYTYNQGGMLAAVSKDGVQLAEYTYDQNGNRIGAVKGGKPIAAEYDAQDRLIRYGDKAITYNLRGQPISVSHLAAKESTNYTYDGLGNLVQVSLSDGRKIEYVIDGLNRRVAKRVDGKIQTRYVYQSQLAIAATLNVDGSVESRFVYGSHINVPDYIVKQGHTYKIVADHLGSPRLAVDAQSGEVAQEIEYDEFGKVIRDTNPGFQPFGYAGGLNDVDTGLVRFGARDYDPEAARFLTIDPLGPHQGGDINPYRYVMNNPVNLVDPDGREPISASVVLIGAGVGGVAGGVAAYLGGARDFSSIATASAIGAAAGATSVISGAVATSYAAAAAANALIGGGANIATQLAMGSSEINYNSVVLSAATGGISGMIGVAAGNAAFFSSPVIGNPVGVSTAVRAGQIGGTVYGGVAGGLLDSGVACHSR